MNILNRRSQTNHPVMEASSLSYVTRIFLRSVVIILASTACLKLLSVLMPLGEKGNLSDPLLPFLTLTQTIGLAALLELLVVGFLVIAKNIRHRLFSIIWICSVFWLYRIGTAAYGASSPTCPCLGTAGDWLGIHAQTLDSIVNGLLGYMTTGALALSAILMIRPKHLRQNPELRIQKSVYLLVIAGFLATTNPPEASAAEFTVNGTIRAVYAGESRESKRTFQVTFKDCKWKILTEVGTPADSRIPMIKVHEFGTSDGESSYMVSSLGDVGDMIQTFVMDESGKPVLTQIPATNVLNTATVFMTPTVVPVATDNLIAPIWAAYAAHCYFETIDEPSLAVPIFRVGEGARELGATVPARWRRNSSPPGVIESIEYFRQEFLYETNTGRLERKRIRTASIQDEFPMYAFEVLTWTNVAGMHLPTQFTMVERDVSGSEQVQYLGVAETVSDFVADANFEPEMPDKTAVIEQRMAQSHGGVPKVKYFTTNGTLRSLSDLKETEEFREAEEAVAKARSHSTRRRLTHLLIAAVLIAPVGWWMFNKRTNKGS